MFEIKLTQGKVAIVDDDMAHLNNYKWHIRDGYAAIRFGPKSKHPGTTWLHHAVIGYPLNGLRVDHINCERLDDRRSNLRIVTHRENCSNNYKRRVGKTSSKYIGVTWNKKIKRWAAYIGENRKRYYLGSFKNEFDAHRAYQKALTEMISKTGDKEK